MRSRINTIAAKNSRVSVYRRKRSVLAGTVTRMSLCALGDVRFLLAWFSRHAQAALAVLKEHCLAPAAAGAASALGQQCPVARLPRQGLGRPGSGTPSGGR